MIARWSKRTHPHMLIGGPYDGFVCDYFGSGKTAHGFCYSIPGVLSFAPLFVQGEAMIPLTPEQANAIDAARDAYSRRGV
jgi:hypothetical protein